MLLIQNAGVVRIKGRGTVVAGRGVKRPIARIGDTVELRSGMNVICTAVIRGIEMINVSPPPPPDRDSFGILIDDPSKDINTDDLTVWLVEQGNK